MGSHHYLYMLGGECVEAKGALEAEGVGLELFEDGLWYRGEDGDLAVFNHLTNLVLILMSSRRF